VTRTADPALRWTVVIVPALKLFSLLASLGSSVWRMPLTVGAADAVACSRRTVLSVSVNETAPPAAVRDQPSGTLTE
jgi:hypothetical protein